MVQLRGLFKITDLLAKEPQVIVVCRGVGQGLRSVWISRFIGLQSCKIWGAVMNQWVVNAVFLMEQIFRLQSSAGGGIALFLKVLLKILDNLGVALAHLVIGNAR